MNSLVRRARGLLLIELLEGMALTLRYMFKPAVTSHHVSNSTVNSSPRCSHSRPNRNPMSSVNRA